MVGRALAVGLLVLTTAGTAAAQQPPPYYGPPPQQQPPQQPYYGPRYAPPPPPPGPYYGQPYYGPYPPPPPPPPPPCQPACGTVCNTSCPQKTEDPWAGVIGVRGAVLSVKGSERDGLTAGATFTAIGDKHDTKDHITWHGSYIWGIGGGSGGVEGGLGLSLAGGFRADVGPEHGPFARIGGMGELWGNDRFYFSRLELPMAELGYQYLSLDSDTLLEIGGRAAPILGGRYNVGDASRRETGSSFEWGGSVAVHTEYGRLDVAYNRIQLDTHALDTPIDTIKGEGCAFVAQHLALCLDGHFLRGDVTLPSGATSTATTIYAGVTLGYARW